MLQDGRGDGDLDLDHTMLPKIALVAPGLDSPGGQGIQASTIVSKLRREGYEVTFIPIDPRFPRGTQRLRRFPYVRTLLNQVLYLPSLLRLRHADVVHVFSASYWSFLLAPVPAILVARRLGKRVVLNYHSGEAADHLARWGKLVHPWLRKVDEIVVPSEYLKRVFARHGYQLRVIKNAVDTSSFHYRERSPLRPCLLSTRNLEPYYAVGNTIIAFTMLRTRYKDATLTIAGSGSQNDELRQLAASLGTNGIKFVGMIEPSAMPRLYEEADIFVNSSVVDNQPVSLLEAFASGLPAVTTGVGDLPNMVRDGVTGLIVPTWDPLALAEAVAFLLENTDRARLFAHRAKEEVNQHTWAWVKDKWGALYAGHRDPVSEVSGQTSRTDVRAS